MDERTVFERLALEHKVLVPVVRAALAYAGPHGLPVSEVLGRTIYPGEPRWLPDDLEAMLEWQAEQARTCSGCGQNLDATVGGGNEEKWNAELSGHCDACRALHRAAMIAAGRDDLDPHAGARYRVWRDEDGE